MEVKHTHREVIEQILLTALEDDTQVAILSVDVTWPRVTPLTAEEKLLREIFEHIGVNPNEAESAALITMVERYKRKSQ